jgi:hypothetical protein
MRTLLPAIIFSVFSSTSITAIAAEKEVSLIEQTSIYDAYIDNTYQGLLQAPFGTGLPSPNHCKIQSGVNSYWPALSTLYVTRYFNIPENVNRLKIKLSVDNNAQIFINGLAIGGEITHEGCPNPKRYDYKINISRKVWKHGENKLEVVASDTGGETYLDLQLLGYEKP